MRLRSCEPNDAEAVLELWKAAHAGGRLADTVAAILTSLERDRDLFVLAEEDGRLVGTLIAGWDGWRGNMYRLAVHPGYRRRGIARALVREAEQRLRAKGARRITALVLDDEKQAQDFWTAAAYDHDTSIRRYVRNI